MAPSQTRSLLTNSRSPPPIQTDGKSPTAGVIRPASVAPEPSPNTGGSMAPSQTRSLHTSSQSPPPIQTDGKSPEAGVIRPASVVPEPSSGENAKDKTAPACPVKGPAAITPAKAPRARIVRPKELETSDSKVRNLCHCIEPL
jgi:hypothetical protein